MNCQNHPEVPAAAYCRTCGKPVCDACRRDAYGTVFCAEHAPAPAPASPYPSPDPAAVPPPAASAAPPQGYYYADVSPGLAFFLGFIPGVGAIYNAQYAKGLVHAVVFGIMVSILDSDPGSIAPLFGLLLTAWIFYMAFEAYHTARKRRMGLPVDEFSSLINLRGRPEHVPVAGVALIVLGVLLLLHTLRVFDFAYMTRYWPVLLIAAGVYLLYVRFTSGKEIGHERQ
jgi:hypothetical protein